MAERSSLPDRTPSLTHVALTIEERELSTLLVAMQGRVRMLQALYDEGRSLGDALHVAKAMLARLRACAGSLDAAERADWNATVEAMDVADMRDPTMLR